MGDRRWPHGAPGRGLTRPKRGRSLEIMKELSGEEASLLALLAQVAQSKNISPEHKREIMRSLDGDALLVAKAITSDTKKPSPEIDGVAKGFVRWAASLGSPKSAHG